MLREIAKTFGVLVAMAAAVTAIFAVLFQWWDWLYHTYQLPLLAHLAAGVAPLLLLKAVAIVIFERRLARKRGVR